MFYILISDILGFQFLHIHQLMSIVFIIALLMGVRRHRLWS